MGRDRVAAGGRHDGSRAGDLDLRGARAGRIPCSDEITRMPEPGFPTRRIASGRFQSRDDKRHAC